MSGWSCKYFLNDFCLRLKHVCTPGCKGCVLNGKVQVIENKKDLKENKKKRSHKEGNTK